MMKILVIDNYDSFTYNLYQLVGQLEKDIVVKRNDKITIDEIRELQPDSIIISPGPGNPTNKKDFGVCSDVIKEFKGKIPNVRFQSGSLETIRKIIDRNGGMTLLPQLSTLYMGARRLKMVRQLTNPVITRTIILVTPRGFEKNRITKVIRGEIIKNLPVQ
jgi:DNA-binding transcriptional LysR family regulator